MSCFYEKVSRSILFSILVEIHALLMRVTGALRTNYFVRRFCSVEKGNSEELHR